MLYNTSNEKTFTGKSFITVFTETYPLYGESGSKQLTEEEYEYVSQFLVALTSFLNIPNQKRLSKTLSVFDIIKNVIHWDVDDEKNNTMSWGTKLLAMPRAIMHALGVIAVLPSSTAKLITEFILGLGEEWCYLGKMNATPNSYLQSAYKIGHVIFSGLHIIGKFLTPSIKGFFPSFSGEDGVYKFLKSAVVYYALLALIGTATFTALTIFAFFKVSTLAFVAILLAEAGLVAYAGYNVYQSLFTEPNPPQSSQQEVKDCPEQTTNIKEPLVNNFNLTSHIRGEKPQGTTNDLEMERGETGLIFKIV